MDTWNELDKISEALESNNLEYLETVFSNWTIFYINKISAAIGSVNMPNTPLLLIALEIIKQNIIRINPQTEVIADELMKHVDIPTIATLSKIQPDELAGRHPADKGAGNRR